VLDELGVGFRVFHGWNSTTAMNQIAQDTTGDREPRVALYVGDFDPSGMYMSEADLPKRLHEFAANVELRRIALVRDQCDALHSFPAADKLKDSRFRWFTQNHGIECWELDAMSPVDLRNIVGWWITRFIDWDQWSRCELAERAEIETLHTILPNMKRAA
jgi:hypothetical protein